MRALPPGAGSVFGQLDIADQLTLDRCGQSIKRDLKLVLGGPACTSEALLVPQLGPVIGVGDPRSRRVDGLEFPPPEMPWWLLTHLGGSPRNPPALGELDHVVLSDSAVPCQRHGEHLADIADSLPGCSRVQVV